eukprot:1942344-Rhodomonas_salina.1
MRHLARLAASGGGGEGGGEGERDMQVLFLTPCHATPYYRSSPSEITFHKPQPPHKQRIQTNMTPRSRAERWSVEGVDRVRDVA